MKALFTILAVLIIGWAAGGWVLMLLIGSLHHSWWDVIPTISYSGALQVELVVMLGASLVGIVKGIAEAVSS